MRKLCLMAMQMLRPIYIAMYLEHDMEEALELYSEMLGLAKASGFSAVDLTGRELDLFRKEDIKRILDEHQLSVSTLLYMAEYAGDDTGKMIEKGKEGVDLALYFGTSTLMLVPRAQENIAAFNKAELAKRLIQVWAPVATYAKERGVQAVIEDTPDLRLPLCTTSELRYILDQVPDLKMVYDSGNMILAGEDPIAYYDTFADRIAHIHLKDMRFVPETYPYADTAFDGQKMTSAPSGKGIVDFQTLIQHIAASGYSGWLTVEYAKDEDDEYLASLIAARNYFSRLLAASDEKGVMV